MKPVLKYWHRLLVIQVFFYGVNGNFSKTTTTANNCFDNECLKPTSRLIRRINVYHSVVKTTPRNLFHFRHMKPSKSKLTLKVLT